MLNDEYLINIFEYNISCQQTHLPCKNTCLNNPKDVLTCTIQNQKYSLKEINFKQAWHLRKAILIQ